MTEVYSVLNQAQMGDLWFIPIIFGTFGGMFFLFLLIRLIKMFTTHKIFIGKILLNIFAMGFVVLWISLLTWGVSGGRQTYAEYCEALENNTCLVESGTPERLEIYKDRASDEEDYEITFYLNGKYFDSYYAYGECNFSESDLELIKNSEIIEVKYIVDEANDNIMLSMSVSSDQGVVN